MVSVYVETYGCTLNHSESEAIKRELCGHDLVERPEDAHVIVLNTCVVTETTERRLLKRVSVLSDNLRDRTLVVTGCAANALAAGTWLLYPKATVMESRLVALFINSQFKSAEGACGPAGRDVTTRIKISHGCEGQCSYCIVRSARGRTQSKPIETVKREIELGVQRGAKQVLLAAQDAGAYGIDIGSSLPELVNAICNLKYDFKLRVGMMNVASLHDIMGELLKAFDDPKIYRFLHLPVQSGSDRILRLMERNHTVSDFKRCVSTFRRRFREITLSTDFIVGFPTETDNDFHSTLKLLRETKPLKVNITRFSPRPGTPAAALDPITARIAKDRSRMLTAAHHHIAYQQNCARVGTTYDALAVEHGKNGSTVLYNGNYRPIVIPRVLPLGTSYATRITQATPTYLRGDF